MSEYGRRTKTLPAPPHVVWADLARPKRDGVRAWLLLLPDEIPPEVLSHDAPRRLVWSSLWPDRPDDTVVFELAAAEGGTALTFALLAAGEPPDQSATGHIRRRMNELLYAELRWSYGQ